MAELPADLKVIRRNAIPRFDPGNKLKNLESWSKVLSVEHSNSIAFQVFDLNLKFIQEQIALLRILGREAFCFPQEVTQGEEVPVLDMSLEFINHSGVLRHDVSDDYRVLVEKPRGYK